MPDLLFGTQNAVLLGTCVLMQWVEKACTRLFDELERLHVNKLSQAPEDRRPPERPAGVLARLAVLVVLGVVALMLRWYEFPALKLRWNDNAYAALVWSLLGLHPLYLLIKVVEVAVMVEKADVRALWVGLLAGPVAWAVQMQASYTLAPWACESGGTWPLHLASLVCLAAAAGGGWLAWRVLGGWPTGADKRRWVAAPAGEHIRFTPTGG